MEVTYQLQHKEAQLHKHLTSSREERGGAEEKEKLGELKQLVTLVT